jgi:hypothetical protein
MTWSRVPVLLLSGPVGAGKSTVGATASELLREVNIPHALIDLAVIGQCWPAPNDDPWNERIIHRNLACMWSTFQQAGASRLILCRVLEAWSLLGQVIDAVPGAQVTVVRLRAPIAVLHARLRQREPGDPSWYLDAATYLADTMERSAVHHHVVDNASSSPREVAKEVLGLAGWLT